MNTKKTSSSLNLSSLVTIGVVVTVLVTTASVLLVVDQFAGSYARKEAETRLKQLAWQMQEALERSMEERQIDMRILVARPSIREGKDLTRMRAVLNELQSNVPNYAWIGLARPDGSVMVSTNGVLEGQSVAQRPWYQEGQKNLYAGDYHPALLLEKKLPPQPEPWRFVDIAMPVKDPDGKYIGVMGMHLSWTWARDIAAKLLNPAGERYDVEVLIVREDGNVMLGPKALEEKKISTQSFKNSLTTNAGGATIEDWPDGQRYITGYSRTGQDARSTMLKWTVLVRQPEQIALEGFKELELRLVLMGGLIGLLLSALALYLTRRLVRPVNSLSAALERRAQGEAVEIPLVDGYREMQVLSSTLVNMVEREGKYLQEVRSLNETLEQRVAERTSRLHETAVALQNALDTQQENQIQLEESSAELRAILHNAHDAFIASDEHGQVREWNRQAEHLLGWTRAEAIGRSMSELIVPPEMREAHERGMAHFLATGQGGVVINNRIELQALHRDGHELPVEITVGHVQRRSGHLFIAFLHDITERLAFRESMREMALTDMLTALPNRRAFSNKLPEAMNRALRERSTMALLFMDIDGFKGVNDKYGHEAGDEMLVMFAKRLLHAVRDVDTVARLAGDEFIVILEKAHETPDAVAVAEKILQTMREPFVLTAATVSVSTSIGVSIYQPERHETPDPEALVARADKAMYDAKKAGKDRVCVFVESMTV